MFLIYIKQVLKDYKKVTATFLEILGFFSLIYGVLDIFLPSQLQKIKFDYKGLLVLLAISLICSIIKNWPKLQRKFTIKNRDINITIVVGDIFKQDGAKVIPTNTTFDTCKDDEFISICSIQGQFQEKYFKNNLGTLDSMIKESLRESKISEILNDGRKTKVERYECGTVSKITCMNERYYLLALADVNKNGTPQAKYENILIALQGLWDFLAENRHIENLVVPIIGTGRAGIAEATRMKVIKDTILSFVAISSQVKITNNLILCIHPNDLKENKIDIDEIFEYVEYTSKYKYEQVDKKISGKPLE